MVDMAPKGFADVHYERTRVAPGSDFVVETGREGQTLRLPRAGDMAQHGDEGSVVDDDRPTLVGGHEPKRTIGLTREHACEKLN